MLDKRRLVWPALVCALIACAEPAFATLTIVKEDGSLATPAEASRTLNPLTNEWDITLHSLYAPGGWSSYEIRGDGGEVINDLIVDVPCWKDSSGNCIPAGSPCVVRVLSSGGKGIATVRNILQTGTAETILNRVEVTEDIGRVEIEVIGIMEAGRDVIGPIISTTKDNPNRGIGIVVALRDVIGDVRADKGRIGTVLAHENIGAAGAHSTIRAKHGTNIVLAVMGIWSHIDARHDGGSGSMYWFYASTFDGTLNTQSLIDNNNYEDPKGRMNIFDEFKGSITIGDPFDNPDHYIELPPLGLTGQIIFNADNHPGGVWSAPVHLGPEDSLERITLDGPNYTIDAELLGGGSIGLAPFSIHLESCDPPSGAVIDSSSAETPPVVKLVHYGPLAIAGPAPVSVARRPLGTDESFQTVSLSEFSLSVPEDESNTLLVEPAESATGFSPGFEYRVTATADLVCNVGDQPAVEWHAPYIVGVEEAVDCRSDVNGNGAVDFIDLLALLDAWGPCVSCPQDIDADDVVGFSDLLLMLFDWGPCS